VAAPVALGYDNGAPASRLPPMGWSSWVALGPGAAPPVFDYCDEFSVKSSVDAFVALGLKDAGYQMIHLDDCWAGPRNATGFLTPEADHFPNGMKVVADYVHSKGLFFGIYTCAGTETCVGGRPGSKDHWAQDAALYAEWGVDWMKMDWCNTNGMVPIEAYGNMSAALNATGFPISFNMCEWGIDNPWEWGNNVAQSWRMHGDHTGVWSSTKECVRASAAIPAAYTGVPYGWNDMDMLETGCYNQCAHANGRESNMSRVEYMTEFSMWAISASNLIFTSPLMNCTAAPVTTCSVSLTTQLSHSTCTLGTSFGCDATNTSVITDAGCRGIFQCNGAPVTCNVSGVGPHTCACPSAPASVQCTPWISDLQKEILLNKEVIAVNQDITPQGAPVNAGDLTVWARMLSDGSAAVALYNENDTVGSIAVKFSDLGWKAGTSAAVRDLWAHTDEGVFTDRYPSTGGISVPPHGTTMLRLTKQ
jgi:hypothetical protein